VALLQRTEISMLQELVPVGIVHISFAWDSDRGAIGRC
jgi:hypothetical protein